jgi:hypothetical protein
MKPTRGPTKAQAGNAYTATSGRAARTITLTVLLGALGASGFAAAPPLVATGRNTAAQYCTETCRPPREAAPAPLVTPHRQRPSHSSPRPDRTPVRRHDSLGSTGAVAPRAEERAAPLGRRAGIGYAVGWCR